LSEPVSAPREITKEFLSSLDGEKLVEALTIFTQDAVFEFASDERAALDAFPDGLKMIYSTWLVDIDVCNGGFVQYFWNGTGDFARHALEGFRLVGATAYESLLHCAMDVVEYSNDNVEDRQAEYGSYEALYESPKGQSVNALSDDYYELKEKQPLWKLQVAHIRSHPDSYLFKLPAD
jgi:hypothetical protein